MRGLAFLVAGCALAGCALAGYTLAGCTLAGCTPGEASLHRALAAASVEFNSSVRWGRYQTAATHLDPSLKSFFYQSTEENDETLQISMVEQLQVTLVQEGGDRKGKEQKGKERKGKERKARKAEIRYRYHWHHASEGILRNTVVVEDWSWTGTQWRLVGIRHGSGPPFPLFERLTPPRPRARPLAPSTARQGASPAP